MENKLTDTDMDNLADIIWWIFGYTAGLEKSGEVCVFKPAHTETLRKIRLNYRDRLERTDNSQIATCPKCQNKFSVLPGTGERDA